MLLLFVPLQKLFHHTSSQHETVSSPDSSLDASGMCSCGSGETHILHNKYCVCGKSKSTDNLLYVFHYKNVSMSLVCCFFSSQRGFAGQQYCLILHIWNCWS